MRKSRGKIIIDSVDKKILSTLQNEGKISNVDMAEKLNLTPPPCLRRIELLENNKVIKGYHAELDSKILGWPNLFHVIVILDTQKEAMLVDFEQLALSWPEVREIHMIRANGDFLLKMVAKSDEHEVLLMKRITSIPYIYRVQTLQTIRMAKYLPGIPL